MNRKYKTKVCPVCNDEFTPTGTRQYRCEFCQSEYEYIAKRLKYPKNITKENITYYIEKFGSRLII